MSSFLKKVDRWHLEILGIPYLMILCFPLIYLCIKDGVGNFVFIVHDQLDETILNYVFTAKYFGSDIYEQMMCGIPSQGLKPFVLLFLPLYRIFNVYVAFLIQYIIVLCTSFYGMYFCIRKLTNSNTASLVSSVLFSLLPIHSIYGNVVMGTPFLIFCLIVISEPNRKKKIWAYVGLVYYALSTSFALSGWAVLIFMFAWIIILAMKRRKFPRSEGIAFLVLFIVYFLSNLDLLSGLIGSDKFISHRTEFVKELSKIPFLQSFKGLLFQGRYVYEAQSLHEWIFLLVVIAGLLLLVSKKGGDLKNKFLFLLGSALGIAFLYAFTSTGFVMNLKEFLPNMISSFQITRWYYFFPGIMYILLGISCAIIVRVLEEKHIMLSYMIVIIACIPTLLYLGKNPDGIFFQNINQIRLGVNAKAYITMKNLYAEDLMEEIEIAIGKDLNSYRVGSIGISPVVSLMHGFYTVDGYSNNYPLSYKKQFREVIAEELEENNYIKEYYDAWGSRCYLFYHEWGNSYMLGNGFHGTITDLRLNLDKLKEMNCYYLFSAGEIVDCDTIGLKFIGEFTNSNSFWDIWVYEIR